MKTNLNRIKSMKTTLPTFDATEDMGYIINEFVMEIGMLLKEAGFDLPETEMPEILYSNSSVRCYDPAIGIHDFDPIKHYGYLEALGAYFPCDEKPEERRFELFTQNIKDVAAIYTITQTTTPIQDPAFRAIYEMNVIYITALVLCHEIAHWFVHQCADNSGMSIGKLQYSLNDEIFFHEGLAQSLVFYGLQEFEHLLELMLWMEGGQPQQYIAYKRLRFDCGKIFKALQIVNQTGMQSFELLEQTLISLAANNQTKIPDILKKFLSQPITPEFQKESMDDLFQYLVASKPEMAEKFRGTYNASKFNV